MPRSIDILLVEDSMADVALLKTVLDSEKMHIRPFTVATADDAIAFLKQQGIYALMPTPDLVLLDWKLPKFEDGERVLRVIREELTLKTLSVALVSGYLQVDEVRRAVELGATCCVEKPLTLAKFVGLVQQIPDFWMTIVRVPIPT
jgi:two-component system, chemotaxis family, response regulator Rcp1